MARTPKPTPPAGALISRAVHTVAFYETDAMGVVHHSNYVRFLEDARVIFLAEHDRPYESIMGDGFHVPVTRVAVSYKWPCRFADRVEVSCWLAWARHASFGFAYVLRVGEREVAYAETDHAVVDLENRPVRIPEPMRLRMQSWRGPVAAAPTEPQP